MPAHQTRGFNFAYHSDNEKRDPVTVLSVPQTPDLNIIR